MPEETGALEDDGSKLPEGIVSEFFVQVVSRLLPGGIFVWLFVSLKDPVGVDSGIIRLHTAAIDGFIFVCASWLCGTALDKFIYAILLFMHGTCRYACFRLLKARRKLLRGLLKWVRGSNQIITYFDPNNQFWRSFPQSEQRQVLSLVCDKIMFRSLGVIAGLVLILKPSNWPFATRYDDPWLGYAAPFFHSLTFGRILGLSALLISLVCWFGLQCTLKIDEKRVRRLKAKSAPNFGGA